MTADLQEDFLLILNRFVSICEQMLKEHSDLGEDSEFLSLYFETLNFILVSDIYDDRFVTFVEASRGDVMLKLFCLDPSLLLGEMMKRGSSAVLFSATLMPLAYFRDILGGSSEDGMTALDFPLKVGISASWRLTTYRLNGNKELRA